MVKLLEQDVLNKEVFQWKGVHLFHFPGSSCSQKTRIVLNLKGVDWTSHIVDLSKGENYAADFLNINPRGLVPTLVIDGEVHIESNDIIALIENRFPTPKLIPVGRGEEIARRLQMEDDLHLDIRTVTFRFTQNRGKAPRSPETLDQYRSLGSGTVLGQKDPGKERELKFWEKAADQGITDEAVQVSAGRLRAALDEVNRDLEANPNLMGADLSLLDIAWFIYVVRLNLCRYPIERLHPKVWTWYQALLQRPEFSKEVQQPPHLLEAITANQDKLAKEGRTLIDVAGL